MLRLERLPPDRWQSARDTAAPETGPSIGRRSFLRRGLGLAVDQAATAFGLAAAEREGIQTVARLLPDTARRGALAPVAPSIDPTACTGCDACVRLCPQGALILDATSPEPCYRLVPDDCTGCGLCVDVCADQAVTLEPWASAVPTQLALAQGTCRDCGVSFHRPAACEGGDHPRCPVCERTRHRRNLFQVYD